MKNNLQGRKHLSSVAFLLFFIGFSSTVLAADVRRGSLLAEGANGLTLAMPLVSTDVIIKVTGPIARTSVQQKFQNDSDQWVEALYLFPLPENAAVDRMRIVSGDRVIEGQIKEKKKARKTYEKAKAGGYKAALIEQDRSNLFHTTVGNIPPRGEIIVNIEYQQSILWRNKIYSLRFPLAITPRFLPATQRVSEKIVLKKGWQVLPRERPQVLAIGGLPRPQTQISISLAPGFDIGTLESPSHPINITSRDNKRTEISVGQDSRFIASRDFILNWAPTSLTTPKAAFFNEEHPKGHFGLVTLTPPAIPIENVFSREVIFVVDTSGSMHGDSIEEAKEALHSGINGLAAGDTFNIIQFDNTASALFSRAVELDRRSRITSHRYIRGLTADGGTNMLSALKLALKKNKNRSSKIRQVVFITDGAVSNESVLFNFIHKNLRDSRLFIVGIGHAPNSYFMKEAAIAGRGTYTFTDSNSDTEATITALFEKIRKPILVDIKISGSNVTDILPKRIPDLYAGEPLVFSMRLEKPLAKVLVTGRLGHVEWKKVVNLEVSHDAAGIAIDWAKRSIDDWQRSYLHGVPANFAKTKIKELGLAYQLVTPYTSLVGVDKTPSRSINASLKSQEIPSPKPDGLKLKRTKYKTQEVHSPDSRRLVLSFAKTANGYKQGILIGLIFLAISISGIVILLARRRIGR